MENTIETHRKCRICNQEKPADKFRKDRKTRRCIACTSKASKAKRKPNLTSNLLMMARARAKRSGREFNLDASDIIIPTHCPIMGTLLNTTPHKGYSPNTPSLDRIDSSKGYIKGNVAVISMRANTIKGALPKEEIIAVAKALIAYMSK